MSIDVLGNLGEFVGAVGVVISLFFVVRQMKQNALQTRRNTRSVRAATFNSMVNNSIRLLEHVFRDKDFAEFLARASAPGYEMSPAEVLRWDAYMTAIYRHFANLVHQWETGAIEDQLWKSYRRSFKDHLSNALWVEWYLNNSHRFGQRLAEEVRSILDEMATEGIPHAVQWKQRASGPIALKG